MKFWIVVVKFLVIGALFLVSNNDLNMGNMDERAEFIGMFSSWMVGLYDQTIEISGYVVNSEWLPRESVEVGG